MSVCLTKAQRDLPAPPGTGFATMGDLFAASAAAELSGGGPYTIIDNGDGSFTIGIGGIGSGFSVIGVIGVGF